MLYLILAVLLIIVDQVTKYLVRAGIPLGGTVDFIPGFLDFTFVQNTGAAFSILERHTWILIVVSILLVVAILVCIRKKVIFGRLGLLSAALVLAGGVGNLIDRLLLGYVTDMIRTLFMDFPVFNFADCCITVGVILLAIWVIFFSDKKKEADHGADLPADHQ